RKNGKSELAAAFKILAAVTHSEPGAQVYTAATKRDQANVVIKKVRKMLSYLKQDSDYIEGIMKVGYYDVKNEENDAIIASVTSDSNTLDGLEPYFVIIDEYHAHKNSRVLDVMESGMGSWLSPHIMVTTTAGFNIGGPCFQTREYAIELLEGKINDPEFFPMIFTLDKTDDWHDENCWIKANPNIGNSPTWRYMRSQFRDAQNQGGEKEVSFKTKNLNLWVSSSDTWISDERWVQGNDEVKVEPGEECFIGIDLASHVDLTAVSLWFPANGSQPHRIKLMCFMPEEVVRTKEETDRAPYQKWVNDGYITTTSGNATDVEFVERYILEQCEKYDVKVAHIDRWNSQSTINRLAAKNVNILKMGQGYASMNEPTKWLERLVLQNEIAHGGNPVLRWMVGNTELKRDPAGNIKPDKSETRKKIDGMVATIMALAGWLNQDEDDESVYSNRGILTI
ncbi:MAG TPA: terminase TerL endonuclease subunit, partial [Candidatus Paceibacterota bacterium]|nr:terminase TerL endonuclease subunit [Candidatus Paceibacterota bacterium]